MRRAGRGIGAIAREMAKAGMFDQALKVAEGIEGHGSGQRHWQRLRRDGEGRDERLAEGIFDQALKVAEGIEDAWWRAWALMEIAEEMAKAGVQGEGIFGQALKVAEGIEEAWSGQGHWGDCGRDGKGRDDRLGEGSL
jgi:hypothetical protein